MINTITVDDEPLALELLQDFIAQTPALNLVAKCNSAAEAALALEANEVQLMFLDIQMPDINGISFLKSLKMQNRPLVVFTTAYNQYALQGFELDVLDYLMKPISFDRFLKTVNKVQNHLAPAVKAAEPSIKQDFIFIKSDYKTFKVNLEDIIYIEGLKDYSKIYTTNGNILTLKSLKAIEKMLASRSFVRVHRSYIIALSKIKMISRNQVTIGNDISIPLSEGFKDELNAIIQENQV